MTEKKTPQVAKPTMSNTKKEMLDAYNDLLKQGSGTALGLSS